MPLFTGIKFGFGASAGEGGGPASGFEASGGTKIIDGGYVYHVFLSPGNFVITSSNITFDVLGIAGGGGGGGPRSGGGGGGAGGVLYQTGRTETSATYPFTIGDGGAAGTTPYDGVTARFYGDHGDTTTLFGQSAEGGGGGNTAFYSLSPAPVRNGGSGGGGGVKYDQPGAAGTGNSTPAGGFTRYGNDGGPGSPYNSVYSGGGGGGSGGIGVNGDTGDGGGDGGPGQAFPIFPAPVISPAIPSPIRSAWISAVGPTGTYAGGGGGGSTTAISPIPSSYYKGKAGGGDGGSGDAAAGTSAVLYTGSGGGAGNNTPAGSTGNGGPGIILIRYEY